MSVQAISIKSLLDNRLQCLVIDVRSPAEFEHAHIPGAINIPLFNNEERKVVGTIYKQQSRTDAIKQGLVFTGPKMVHIIEQVEALKKNHLQAKTKRQHAGSLPPNTIIVHCWRGGMRSAAVAWLLSIYGFKVHTLQGGYKSFRQWAGEVFTQPYNFHIVGGYTGSGKTGIIQHLVTCGQKVVDLEGLANHKGSAFGSIDMPGQPSQEMFENMLALDLAVALHQPNEMPSVIQQHIPSTQIPGGTIWLEDESQRIGRVNIPDALWKQMRSSPVLFMNIPFEQRLQHLVNEYGTGSTNELADAITRIQKRLGGLETKTALQYLQDGNLQECCRILLTYYDKYYLKGLKNRDNVDQLVTYIDCGQVDPLLNTNALLQHNQLV